MIKVNLSLCLTKYYAMKMSGGVEVLHVFWTSEPDGSEWSASRRGRFIPGERIHGTNWVGGWVIPRVCLDAVARREDPCLYRQSNPVVEPVG